MKRAHPYRQRMSLLLVAALLLALAPTGYSVSWQCSHCNSTKYTKVTITPANCHEEGVDRYTCSDCKTESLVSTPIDPYIHDSVCTDNGDGQTHTATCPYHPDTYAKVKEPHVFENGCCTKCLAINYNEVTISAPKEQLLYVSLGDTAAPLSLGTVRLTVGTADITEDYNLTYNWYLDNAMVGSGETYTLPADATAEEKDYTYVCFVMASPKNSLVSKPINTACTVNVRVRELVTAYAAISAGESSFSLTETNSHTPVPVTDQLYEAIAAASEGEPGYVVFDVDAAAKSEVGELNAVKDRKYDFNTASGAFLGNLRFTPSKKGTTGSYVISFTATDSLKKEFLGTLTITVEETIQEPDVLYVTEKAGAVSLRDDDFVQFWQDTYDQGTLTSISFKTLPAASSGILYTGYTTSARPGTRVKTTDTFFYTPSAAQTGLDVTFVPNAKFTGPVDIVFEAYGRNNRDKMASMEGHMYIFVNSSGVEDVVFTVSDGGGVAFSANAFLPSYQAATGSKDSNFYIQLLEIPASGSLYVGSTGSNRDTLLKKSNLMHYPLYATANAGNYQLGNATYISGIAPLESVRYAAYSNKGTFLYVGKISFTKGNFSVPYVSGPSGTAFEAADFEDLLGTDSGVYLTFTPPSFGTLAYRKTGTVGTAVANTDKFYLGTTNAASVSQLYYTPGTGQNGVINIPFTAHFTEGAAVNGEVKITVRTSETFSVSYPAGPSGVAFEAEDFEALLGTDSGIYLTFTPPSFGTLLYRKTGTAGIAITNTDKFYLGTTNAASISQLYYTPGTGQNGEITIPFTAHFPGKTAVNGEVKITVRALEALSVSYSAGAAGVSFASADFETLLGQTDLKTYLTFTPPTSGTLTYTKTGTNGTAVTATDKYYLGTNLVNVNNLLYTPKTGQNGVVTIPFVVHMPDGITLNGTVNITVRTTYSVHFDDVKSNQWFYPYVMELAEAKIINGMTPTTFEPDTTVTYGMALKLILLAAGYPEPQKTGNHWASGYLDLAVENNLIARITEKQLDMNIARYNIAEIAAKALKMSPSTLKTSPFTDMEVSSAYAPYVLALYEAGIVGGAKQSDGTVLYYGTYAIKRSEMAKIIWMMNDLRANSRG